MVSGETRAPREGSVVVPLVRMPSAERETGGVAVDVVGAGENLRAPGARARARRSQRARRPGGRPRVAVDDRVPPPAARRRRTARALGHGRAVHAAGGADRQRRGGALPRARVGGRPRAGARRAMPCATTSAASSKVSLPAGASLWSARVAGRPIRPGIAEQDAVLLPLEKGRAGEEAPTFVLELIYLQRTNEWPVKGARDAAAASARSADLAHRSDGALLAALQGGARSRARSVSRTTSARSPRPCAPRCRPRPLRSRSWMRGPPPREPRARRPGCRHSSIDFRTRPAAAAWPARCPSR